MRGKFSRESSHEGLEPDSRWGLFSAPFPSLSPDFMEAMLSHGKGVAFFPHTSHGVLGAHQQLSIHLTACANMWGEYWDNLTCTVRPGRRVPV